MSTGDNLERFTLVKDDDGHTYLIKANEVQRFYDWLETEDFWCNDEYDYFDSQRVEGRVTLCLPEIS